MGYTFDYLVLMGMDPPLSLREKELIPDTPIPLPPLCPLVFLLQLGYGAFFIPVYTVAGMVTPYPH